MRNRLLLGRCAEQNDLIGSNIIINRILNKLMKLCFYYENKYYPYSKWFGKAFKKLKLSDAIFSLIENVIYSSSLIEKQNMLNNLYIQIVNKHNSLGLTDYVEPQIINYYNRGYRGLNSEEVLEKINKNINWSDIKNPNYYPKWNYLMILISDVIT